jgi:hypothetical protein
VTAPKGSSAKPLNRSTGTKPQTSQDRRVGLGGGVSHLEERPTELREQHGVARPGEGRRHPSEDRRLGVPPSAIAAGEIGEATGAARPCTAQLYHGAIVAGIGPADPVRPRAVGRPALGVELVVGRPGDELLGKAPARSLARDRSSSRRAPPNAASNRYLSSACRSAAVFMTSGRPAPDPSGRNGAALPVCPSSSAHPSGRLPDASGRVPRPLPAGLKCRCGRNAVDAGRPGGPGAGEGSERNVPGLSYAQCKGTPKDRSASCPRAGSKARLNLSTG